MKAKTKTVKKVKVVKPKKEVKAVKKPNKADKWKVFSDETDDEDFDLGCSEPEPTTYRLIVNNGKDILFRSSDGLIYAYKEAHLYCVKVLENKQWVRGPLL